MTRHLGTVWMITWHDRTNDRVSGSHELPGFGAADAVKLAGKNKGRMASSAERFGELPLSRSAVARLCRRYQIGFDFDKNSYFLGKTKLDYDTLRQTIAKRAGRPMRPE